jgi:hypothetical protein
MRDVRSLMFLVSSMLLLPAHSAHSTEIKISNIKSTCNLERVSILLPFPLEPELPSASLVFRGVEDMRQLEKLIATKQWDAALEEFRNASEGVKLDMLRPLMVALVKANEVQRASRFLIQQFPARSEIRVKGIGTIAAELTARNQFQSAIELLKTIPQTSEYFADATIPVIEILAKTNQMQAIAQVMALFPDDEARSSFLYRVTRRIGFLPEQVKQVAGITEDAGLRPTLIARMANFWLNQDGEAILNGWKIANEIEDCSVRLNFFVDAFDRLKTANLNLSDAQKARSLNQLEALLNARDAASSYKRLDQRVALARLNIEHGRKAQGIQLLQQVTELLKQEQSYYSRAATLVEVAKQYTLLGNKTVAVQLLDAAVIAADASAKPQNKIVDGLSLPMILPPKEMRDDLLRQIAKAYRSLNQSQKASAIEKRIPKRPLYVLPRIAPAPSLSIPSAPIQPIPIAPIPRR